MIGLVSILAVGSGDVDGWVVLVTAAIGLIVLPYLLAFLVELIKQKKGSLALKSAGSATAVYLADTMLKLLILYVSVYYMFMC